MTEELDKKLCEEFPDLFRDRNGSITETCMAWGFSCNDGWYDLLRGLCLTITNILYNAKNNRIYTCKKIHNIDYSTDLPKDMMDAIEQNTPCVVVDQVKEKFGTLRFYWHGENLSEREGGEVDGAVSLAERMSSIICEYCGNKGKLCDGGWLTTHCDACPKN